jgi:transposase
LDSVWLCKVGERQMLRPSFVPPPEIRVLRDLTRYRIDQVGVRTAEKQRVEKLLEDAQVKLSVVASDIFGVSGREMMAALVAGERDPRVLAQMARARLRAKISDLEEAFHGSQFGDHHAFLLSKMLARVDAIDADLADLEARIEEEILRQVVPLAEAVARLDAIPGVGVMTAQVILAEVGAGHDSVPDRGASGVVGEVRADRAGVGRQEEGQGRHRAWQQVSGARPG